MIVQLGEESECGESCFCPWHPRECLAQLAQPCNPDPSGGHCFSGGANSSGSGLASLSPCCYFLFKTSQHRGERYAGQQKAATENRSIGAICKGELKQDYDPHTSPVTKSSFPRALASAFQRGKSLSTIRHQCRVREVWRREPREGHRTQLPKLPEHRMEIVGPGSGISARMGVHVLRQLLAPEGWCKATHLV